MLCKCCEEAGAYSLLDTWHGGKLWKLQCVISLEQYYASRLVNMNVEVEFFVSSKEYVMFPRNSRTVNFDAFWFALTHFWTRRKKGFLIY